MMGMACSVPLSMVNDPYWCQWASSYARVTATPSQADTAGLRRLAAQCGDDFAGGLLLHAGAHSITLDDPRFLAVPIAKLWEW